MHPTLEAAFNAEVQRAERALANDDLADAFAHLERAHVLGQWYVKPHVMTHLGVLRVGWRRRDLREIFGQLLRIPGGMIGSAIGRVPRGNTGGSPHRRRVTAVTPRCKSWAARRYPQFLEHHIAACAALIALSVRWRTHRTSGLWHT